MFTSFVKPNVIAATALTVASAAFAGNTAPVASQGESFELAQTIGMDRRQNRRGDRQDDRQDRRYDRQDCRSSEGLVGKDKRDCKQMGRQGRNLNG